MATIEKRTVRTNIYRLEVYAPDDTNHSYPKYVVSARLDDLNKVAFIETPEVRDYEFYRSNRSAINAAYNEFTDEVWKAEEALYV